MYMKRIITEIRSADRLILYMKKYYLVFGIVFFSVIKFLMVNQLPLAMSLYSNHDGYLMVSLGNSILNGEWLGSYNNRTLVKGFAYPLFLAISNQVGISCNDALIVLYMAACIVFCAAMRYVVKKKWMLLVLYVVLLFNPASMDFMSFQNIYRCSLTPAQVLLIFGSFWGLYFCVCKQGKTGIAWAILEGLSLFFFWNTREDSVWILPFVGTIIFISIITVIIKSIRSKKTKRRNIVYTVFIFFLPVLFLKCGNLLVSYANEVHYGIFTVNELRDSNFVKAMECLYAIKPEENIPCVDITREKLQRVYEVSPTLSSIKESLETNMDRWDLFDCNPGDHEVENGWAMWAFRDAVQDAGYYKSATEANNFYGKVAKEIHNALDKGMFEKQGTMMGVLMPPWRKNSIKDYFYAVRESIMYLSKFKNTEAYYDRISDINNQFDYMRYQEFSRLTMSPINVNLNIGQKYIKGWAFSKFANKTLSLDIMSDSDEIIKTIELEESSDPELYVKNVGIENAKVYRFEEEFFEQDNSGIYVRIYDDSGHDAFYYEDGTYEGNDEIGCYIDELDRISYSNYDISLLKDRVKQVNQIVGLYQKYNLVLCMVAILLYLYLIFLFFKWKGIHTEQIWDNCLVLTSLIASVFVLIIGVSYTHIFGWPAISSSYYSGAYPLILAYEVLAVYLGITELIQYRKNKFVFKNIEKDV